MFKTVDWKKKFIFFIHFSRLVTCDNLTRINNFLFSIFPSVIYLSTIERAVDRARKEMAVQRFRAARNQGRAAAVGIFLFCFVFSMSAIARASGSDLYHQIINSDPFPFKLRQSCDGKLLHSAPLQLLLLFIVIFQFPRACLSKLTPMCKMLLRATATARLPKQCSTHFHFVPTAGVA